MWVGFCVFPLGVLGLWGSLVWALRTYKAPTWETNLWGTGVNPKVFSRNNMRGRDRGRPPPPHDEVNE